MGQLETSLRSDIASMRGEIAQLDARLRGEIAATEGRLTAMVHVELAALTRTFIIAMIGAMVTIAGIAFGAAHMT
jgi:hypothetical protein